MIEPESSKTYGWANLGFIGALPRVNAAINAFLACLAVIPQPPPSLAEVCEAALRAHESAIVKLNFRGCTIARQALHYRITMALDGMFNPKAFAHDLYLNICMSRDRTIPVADLVQHPKLSFIAYNTQQMQSKVSKQMIEALCNTKFVTEGAIENDELVSVRVYSLKQAFITIAESLFSESIASTDASMKKWTQASATTDGWISLDTFIGHQELASIVEANVTAAVLVLRESNIIEVGKSGESYLVRHRRATITPPPMTGAGYLNDEEADDDDSPRPPPIDPNYVPTPTPIVAYTPPVARWSPSTTGDGDFSVMSYNILADFFPKKAESFPYCVFESLSWHNRFGKIIDQVLAVMPSVIGFQEVQCTKGDSKTEDNHYRQLEAEMKQAGYKGEYIRKNSTNQLDIGNALFWSSDFVYVSKRRVYFSNKISNLCGENDASKAYFAFGEQVALLICLLHKPTGRHVIFVNTHIWCAYETRVKQVRECKIDLQRFLIHLPGCPSANLPGAHPGFHPRTRRKEA